MVATFLGCIVIFYWLPHTPVQIFFHLILDVRKFELVFSLSIQTRVFGETLRITLIRTSFYNIHENIICAKS